MENEIAGNTQECSFRFRRLIELMQHDKGFTSHQFTVSDLEDEFEQFRVWVRNVGACAADHASLDFRLRDADAIRTTILTILNGLHTSLLHCSSIVTGQRPPYNIKAGFGDRGSESGSNELSDTESDIDEEATRLESELDVRFEDIVESVDKLAQIAFAIRKSSGWSRNARGAAYEEWEDGINQSAIIQQYIANVLQFRLPDTNVNVRRRLVVAISERRRQFAYFRRHQKKLFYGTSDNFETFKIRAQPNSGETSGKQGKIAEASNISGSFTAKLSAPSLLLSQTTASTLHPELFVRDTGSSISSGSSRSQASGQVDASLPPPPADNKNDRYFQCPYCCLLLPRAKLKRRAWRKHVIADLRPYVCVFDDCQDQDLNIESEDDWLQHQLWQHNLVWCCDGFEHPPETFTSRNAFDKHMKTLHADNFQDNQLDMLAKISGRPSSTLFEHCPFCDYSSRVRSEALDQDKVGTRAGPRRVPMQDHVISHLLSIFLLALPGRDDLLNDGFTDRTSMTVARSIPSLNDVELSFEDVDFAFSDADVDHNQDIMNDVPSEAPETSSEEWAFARTEDERPEPDLVLLSIAQYIRPRQEPVQLPSSDLQSSLSDFHADHPPVNYIKRYGITEVYSSLLPSSAQVDLVLVHGLYGHPEHTWTSHFDGFWPRELLRFCVGEQRVRMLVYGYNADAKSLLEPEKISHDAERLLEALYENRTISNALEHPILFLAHSTGGFIVSSALSSARKSPSDYRSLVVSTFGLLFFGKPNYRPGIEPDRWTDCIERIYKATTQQPDRKDTEQTVRLLKQPSLGLQEIDIEFFSWMTGVLTYYFHEAKRTDLNGVLQWVVDEELASPLSPGCERAGINEDHKHMCQFDNLSSVEFRVVVEAISRYAEGSVDTIQRRWAAEHLGQNSLPKPEVESPDFRSDALPVQSDSKATKPYFVVPSGFRPTAFFVGREQELEYLEAQISMQQSPGEGVAAIIVLGQAGVGKRALVRQHFHLIRRQRFPGGLFWVEGSGINQLRMKFQNMVQSISMRTPDLSGASDSDLSITDARAWFEARSGWLIVFDCSNIDGKEDDKAIMNMLPLKSINSCIICISRSGLPENTFRQRSLSVMEVPPLKPEAARALLFHALYITLPTEPEMACAKDLISKVGGLPVTILDIAQRMRSKGQSLEQFDPDLEPDSHLFKVYNPIFQTLREEGHGKAITLLYILCLLKTGVSIETIASSNKVLLTLGVISEPPDLYTLISILIKYELVKREDSLVDSRNFDKLDVAPEVVLLVDPNVQKYCTESLRLQGYFHIFLSHAIDLFNESYIVEKSGIQVKHRAVNTQLRIYYGYLGHGRRLRGLVDTCSNSEQRDMRIMCDKLDTTSANILKRIKILVTGAPLDVTEDYSPPTSIFGQQHRALDSIPEIPPGDIEPVHRSSSR